MGKINDQSIVTIKPLAYYKMLLHVLRFGSKYIEHAKLSEVMGVLIGRLEGEGEINDVIIEDVVPVSHGGSIEVKFSVDQLGAFGELDTKIWEQYGDLGWFSVGWYHSHPGLGIFFSETDKYNQIFWQKNPNGVGIVFDHTYLDKPNELGFRAFRLSETNLDDPSLALKSGYHEVKANVIFPDNLEFYLKIIDLINKIHTGSPQILELNETIDLFSDVFIPEDEQIESKLPEVHFDEIISTLKKGMENFLESSIRPIVYFLNTWGQDVVNKISINNMGIRNDLKEIRDKLSNEIINLQQSFNYDLQNDIKDLDFYVDDKLEDIDNEKEKIEELVLKSKEEFINQIRSSFEDISFSQLLEKVEKGSNGIVEFNKNFSNNIKSLNGGSNALKKYTEKYKSIDNLIKSDLNTVQEELLTNFNKKVSKIKGNLITLYKETKNYLSDLKAAIILLESSKNPIKNKLSTLQSENKELQKTIKNLRAENQVLSNKIKKLEKEGD
jgi:proteasome lid subunit RPN8/RPN11